MKRHARKRKRMKRWLGRFLFRCVYTDIGYLVLQSLRQHPERWTVAEYHAIRYPHKGLSPDLSLWIANGSSSLKVDIPFRADFGWIEAWKIWSALDAIKARLIRGLEP